MERWREGEGGWADDNRRDSRATAPSKDKPAPCGYLLSPELFFFFSLSLSVGPHKGFDRIGRLTLMPAYMHISSCMYTIVLKPNAAV